MRQTILVIGLMILAVAINWKACTSPSTATRVLTESGYTQIEITGHAWFACDEKDTFATAFKAKGPTGQQVSGAVCSGIFKNNTVRLY